MVQGDGVDDGCHWNDGNNGNNGNDGIIDDVVECTSEEGEAWDSTE
jgi:hypothetical protein